ncbi:MAG: aspartyl protease family protein [Phycisphaerales bacterium]|nr:aspartyl protease family protein [Phycisphaerales bacterium]
MRILMVGMFMWLIPAVVAQENPWKERVADAVAGAQGACSEALDVCWRADAWQEAVSLAKRAEPLAKTDAERAAIARAYWRSGRYKDAERVAAMISKDTRDRLALRVLLLIASARDGREATLELARRLESIGLQDATDFALVATVRLAENELKGIADLARQILKHANADNGYPESMLMETAEGLPEFLAGAGERPLNHVVSYGEVPMPPVPMFNLPYVDATINGHGPYRFIVDTGGSVTFSIDREVAEEAGLKKLSGGSIRGVSGTQESAYMVLDDLRIGPIQLQRVMVTAFDFPDMMKGAIGGIIGTGIFHEGRMTMNFAEGRFALRESSAKPGPGVDVDVRIVSDSKLVALCGIGGHEGLALFDTGADAVALSQECLERVAVEQSGYTVSSSVAMGVGDGEGGGAITLNIAADLEIAGRKFEDMGVVGLSVLDDTLGPFIGAQCDLLVGMGIYREMKTLTVDFPRRKMWVDWR